MATKTAQNAAIGDPEAIQAVKGLLEQLGTWGAVERRLGVNRGLLWRVVHEGLVSPKVRGALMLDAPPRITRSVEYDGKGRPARLVFNVHEGQRRGGLGKEAAARMRAEVLGLARSIAREAAQSDPAREATIDDVMEGLVAEGYSSESLGNRPRAPGYGDQGSRGAPGHVLGDGNEARSRSQAEEGADSGQGEEPAFPAPGCSGGA